MDLDIKLCSLHELNYHLPHYHVLNLLDFMVNIIALLLNMFDPNQTLFLVVFNSLPQILHLNIQVFLHYFLNILPIIPSFILQRKQQFRRYLNARLYLVIKSNFILDQLVLLMHFQYFAEIKVTTINTILDLLNRMDSYQNLLGQVQNRFQLFIVGRKSQVVLVVKVIFIVQAIQLLCTQVYKKYMLHKGLFIIDHHLFK